MIIRKERLSIGESGTRTPRPSGYCQMIIGKRLFYADIYLRFIVPSFFEGPVGRWMTHGLPE